MCHCIYIIHSIFKRKQQNISSIFNNGILQTLAIKILRTLYLFIFIYRLRVKIHAYPDTNKQSSK